MKNSIYYFLKRIQNKYFAKYHDPQKEDLAFFSKLIKEGDLVFDVGANQGDMTQLFLQLGASVVSVEPQKTFAEILNRRYRKNEKVNIVNKALSSQVGTSEILICDTAPTISTMSKDWATKGRFTENFDWNRKETIHTTTLDKLIEQFGTPRFCKIDVEGFEFEVISGLSQKIPVISIEYVNEFFDKTEKCIEHLQSIGPIEVSTRNEELGIDIDQFYKPEDLLPKLKGNGELVNGDIYIKFQ